MDGMSGSQQMGKLRFLIALGAVLTLMSPAAEGFWWKYGSMAEALNACVEWADKQGKFQIYREYTNYAFETEMVWDSREVAGCVNEVETQQVLGWAYQVKAGSRWPNGWRSMPNNGKQKVVKRFRY